MSKFVKEAIYRTSCLRLSVNQKIQLKKENKIFYPEDYYPHINRPVGIPLYSKYSIKTVYKGYLVKSDKGVGTVCLLIVSHIAESEGSDTMRVLHTL